MFRVRGKLVAHQSEPLSAEHCEALVFSIMSEDQKKTFSERLDCDFSHGIAGLARFRINVFRQRASVAAAFRRIPYQIPAMEQSLKGLVDKRWISADDALESCFDPKEMARLLGRK